MSSPRRLRLWEGRARRAGPSRRGRLWAGATGLVGATRAVGPVLGPGPGEGRAEGWDEAYGRAAGGAAGGAALDRRGRGEVQATSVQSGDGATEVR